MEPEEPTLPAWYWKLKAALEAAPDKKAAVGAVLHLCSRVLRTQPRDAQLELAIPQINAAATMAYPPPDEPPKAAPKAPAKKAAAAEQVPAPPPVSEPVADVPPPTDA